MGDLPLAPDLERDTAPIGRLLLLVFPSGGREEHSPDALLKRHLPAVDS
ncbi:MAG: hypothetical protein ABIP48_15200 [Planctomycetota bacterium]